MVMLTYRYYSEQPAILFVSINDTDLVKGAQTLTARGFHINIYASYLSYLYSLYYSDFKPFKREW